MTGAGTGIGRGIALRFAGTGAHVIVADIDERQGRGIVKEIEFASGGARFVRLSVTSEDAWATLTDQVLSWVEHINILFNNAGMP